MVPPTYGGATGGAFLVTPDPTRSLGVLETMMRQMIGKYVNDSRCFLLTQQSHAVNSQSLVCIWVSESD
jgi:hypothetical protein